MEFEVNWSQLRDEALAQGYDGHNRKPSRVSRKQLRHRRQRRRSRIQCRLTVRNRPVTTITEESAYE
ncbi:MAG: hypothetical protein IT301_13325 [Dehalococcoidia bacterium]|nr:hypothetical protein [Dehalococcoidia bacterium]